jgi:hypothetical protein
MNLKMNAADGLILTITPDPTLNDTLREQARVELQSIMEFTKETHAFVAHAALVDAPQLPELELHLHCFEAGDVTVLAYMLLDLFDVEWLPGVTPPERPYIDD